MIKKIFTCAALIAAAPSALADNNLELKVSGNIAPVACDITIGNGGTVDYGNISPDTLSSTDVTKLAVKEIPMQIDCAAPIKLAVKTLTRRPGSGYGGTHYTSGNNALYEATMLGQYFFHGLGLSDGKKTGGYVIVTDTAKTLADAKSVNTIIQLSGQKNWSTNTIGNLFRDFSMLQSWSEKSKTEPYPFKTLNTVLRIQAYIAPKDDLDTSKPIKLDGMSVMEIIYI